MHVEALACTACGERYPPDEVRYRCGECGGSLDVVYDYSEREREGSVSWELLRGRDFSHLRYREFLPVSESGREARRRGRQR
ncbi:MAG: Threonine synthase [Methanonatronarchaeales archaeon]|nr:Threonine synthase [Methanonatronarchaeales archaeon]